MADFGQALANLEMPQINEDELNGFANFLEQGLGEDLEDADAWRDLHEFLFRWRNDLDGQQRQQQRAFFQTLANRALTEARNLAGLNNPPVPVRIRPQVPAFLEEEDLEEEEEGEWEGEREADDPAAHFMGMAPQAQGGDPRNTPNSRRTGDPASSRGRIRTPPNLDSDGSMVDEEEFAPGPRPVPRPRSPGTPNPESPRGRGKPTIRIPYEEFVKEHRHLLDVLSKGDRKSLREEYEAQKAELGRHGRF
jgi:hypothetical protein